MMKNIENLLLQSALAAFAVAVSASFCQADTIVLDPDGSGNSPNVNLNTFQFGAGNSLDRAALPYTVGTNFQLLFHGQLNSIVNSAGAQITPLGLNASGAVGAVTPYEITIVGSVTESVTNVNANLPARVLYRLATTQASASFVEIYFDGNQNANPLQGTGYNDGTIILRGVPVPAQPNLGMLGLTNPQPGATSFDSFVTNDYPGIISVAAVGGTKLSVMVTGINPAFFVAPGQGDAGRQVHVGDIISLDLSQATPFDKVDPSHRFAAVANTTGGAGPSPSATPAVGTVNGNNGTDLQAQTLIAASIRAASPTPTPVSTPTPTPSATPTVTPTPTSTPSPTVSPAAPRVAISANKTQVREGNDVVITFTFRGSTTHSAITVNYSVGGTATLNTDFTLSGTPDHVIIPANAASASITLHANTDSVNEPNGETAKLLVEPGSGYEVPTQVDAKRVSILILDPGR